jgi:hypothetical protein
MTRAALILLVLGAGCRTPAQKREEFGNAVRMYNEGVRWQRFDHAAAYIPSAERGDFIDERVDLEKELRIDDFEILRSDLEGSGHRAKVRVRYTWHMDREGIVHETSASQSWELRGQRWLMVEERRVRGPSMPGLVDPVEAADAPRDRVK